MPTWRRTTIRVVCRSLLVASKHLVLSSLLVASNNLWASSQIAVVIVEVLRFVLQRVEDAMPTWRRTTIRAVPSSLLVASSHLWASSQVGSNLGLNSLLNSNHLWVSSLVGSNHLGLSSLRNNHPSKVVALLKWVPCAFDCLVETSPHGHCFKELARRIVSAFDLSGVSAQLIRRVFRRVYVQICMQILVLRSFLHMLYLRAIA